MARLSLFNRLTSWAATAAGSPAASIGAAAVVAIWAACGPVFKYSETWQLVINTGTTIVTFLMVCLIQSSQNRDSCAVHLKRDQIIRALDGAKDELMDLEGLDQVALDKSETNTSAAPSWRAKETPSGGRTKSRLLLAATPGSRRRSIGPRPTLVSGRARRTAG